MQVVVADTGPLRYLVLIEAVDLLPRLFGKILVPDIVLSELDRARTPLPVRAWLSAPPAWLEGCSTPAREAWPFPRLGDGERAAIALAQARFAPLLLMDDRAGVAVARAHGFDAVGTLGILARAATQGLVDLPAAFARLRTTNFRCRPELMDELLARYRGDRPATTEPRS